MAAQLAMRFFSSTSTPASPVTSSPSLPSPGPSPASGPSRRPETVLPSVICKLCGLSIPVDMLTEHDCQTGGASSSSSQPPPTRRPSEPRRRRSPSPTRDEPPNNNSGLEPPSALGMHQRSTTLPDSRPNASSPLSKHQHSASTYSKPPDRHLSPTPPQPPPLNRTPSPGQQQQHPSTPSSLPSDPSRPAQPLLSVFAQPPSRPVVAPQIPLMQHHQTLPTSISNPERITSPEFETHKLTKRSNSETPYPVQPGIASPPPLNENEGGPREGNGPREGGGPPTGREALSTYGVPMPDTKVGGEAGMAGVGRRGFAAVAQAALFVSGPGRTPSPGTFLMGGGPPSRMGSPAFMGGPPPMGPNGQMMGPPNGQMMGPNGQMMAPGFGMRTPSPGFGPGQRLSPGPPAPPFLGQDPRMNGPPSGPPYNQRTPSPRLDTDVPRQQGQRSPLSSPPIGSSPQRPSDSQLPAPNMSRQPSDQRTSPTDSAQSSTRVESSQGPSRTMSIKTDGSSTPTGGVPVPPRVPPSRRNTDVSSYTQDEDNEPSSPIRRSPSPMTNDDRQGLDRKADNRVSDASSSYTTASLAGGGTRQAVSNVKPSMTGSVRHLFRKASGASSSSSTNPTSPTETGSVRLPFFEKLKAKVGSQSSSGSSVSKSNSLRSIGSVGEAKIRVLEKGLPPVRERRESSSSTTSMGEDAGLAYADFDVPPKVPPVPGKEGNSNSIPFPVPPEKVQPELRLGVRADSESTASSSESSSAPSSAFGSVTKPAVGVKIVAVDPSPRIVETQVNVGSAGMLGGDLITPDRQISLDPLSESPTSSPSPTSTSFSAKKKKTRSKAVRQCRKCRKVIHDGKWVRVDVGTPDAGIMCEWDWKDSYLPKCRRCTLPIEGRVISAVDGQITGKFHRACFTCYKCSTPFPDKTFYVHDGMPHCKFHYAEANGSLCASSSCGQPIEGACAVADDGRRFHPEHFVCDWNGGEHEHPSRRDNCTNRLEDYWEVGDQKYCSERHALWAQDALDAPFSNAEPRVDSSSSRATKRRTMFVEQVVDRVAL